VCVWVCRGGVRRVKGTCEILRHVLNKIHISIYIPLVSKSKWRVVMSHNSLPLATRRELRLIIPSAIATK